MIGSDARLRHVGKSMCEIEADPSPIETASV